jgi:SAM-dependent methyltransferase
VSDGVVDRRITLRERARRGWRRLRGGELTPSRAFWSVAIGLFVGVQPTPGLHLPVVVGVCVPLRLDAPVSYLAANISIPPIAPFLWLSAIQIGSYALHGRFVALTHEGMRDLVRAPGPMLGALVLGSVILGVALGALGGAFAYVVARARRSDGARAEEKNETDDPHDAALSRTAERFETAAGRRSTYHYVRSKLRRDPCTRAIAALAPLGNVVDVGCGRGQLAVFLLERGAASRVRGYDWDEAKVAAAARAAGERDGRAALDATFVRADVRDTPLAADADADADGDGDGDADDDNDDRADTVLLVDVLHYLPRAEQDAVLDRVAKLVRVGGRLVVREASSGHGWRSVATLVAERIGTVLRINRGGKVVFRDVGRELAPRLEALGFSCDISPCWRGTPFSNVLLVAIRRGALARTSQGTYPDTAA